MSARPAPRNALLGLLRGVPLATALLLFVGACASGPSPAAPPAQSAPVAVQPASESTPGDPRAMLEPPAAAVRAAATAELSGRELGSMWTFENPPLEEWREQYGFEATPAWLEHVRLSSVRYGEICSASFVSRAGLVMTNHHCARQCVESVSTEENDYVVTGFQARELGEELLCPGLYLDQLVDIEDVTARIRSAVPAGAGPQLLSEARATAIEQIEQECGQRTDNECQVVTLFQGGQFQLYTYRRYAPVKLVFAPELQAGFFGGDPDNFTYPRYALDVSFVRAYEAGDTPAETPHYFAWDPEGAAEDELVFITGNPGSTSRLISLAQLLYERAYRHPFMVEIYDAQRQLLMAVAAMGPDAERAVRDDLFSVENSLKAFSGQLRGLQDTALVATKIAWEGEFRRRFEATPSAQEFADVWDALASVQVRKLETSPVLNAANTGLLGAPQLAYASMLSDYLAWGERPEAERPPPFRGERFTRLRQILEEPRDIPESQVLLPLELHLAVAQRWLPAGHVLREALFRPGEDAATAARRLTTESRILDAQRRRDLIAGGLPALQATDDPLMKAVLLMDSIYPAVAPVWEALLAEEEAQNSRLAEALFAVFGTDLPPDATFTLRISDGVVSRYPYNGTFAPAKTTLYGLYARAAEFDNEMPWTLPVAFQEARARVDMSQPLNFVSTNDITGGNSGSPMIDRDARVVGIAFDGNIEQLPNEFVFRTEAGRTVAVHSAGILEALRNVYQADELVGELLEGAP